jgi:hypothetical protein
MRKYPILLLAWLLPFGVGGEVHAQALRAKLTEALKTYCVPKVEQTCVSLQARYQDGSCYCGQDPTYMRYKREDRSCEVFCRGGMDPRVAAKCPAGTNATLVKEF